MFFLDAFPIKMIGKHKAGAFNGLYFKNYAHDLSPKLDEDNEERIQY